jgi:hypothetical protein
VATLSRPSTNHCRNGFPAPWCATTTPHTTIPSSPLGDGRGDDILFGSDGRDELLGGQGNGRADATTGNDDRWVGEIEENCELD